MRRIRKPKPLGVCNVCGQLSDQIVMINHRCTHTVHGRRCAGLFKSELSHVWVVCESCDAVGKVGTVICSECSGFGWRLLGA